MLQRTAGASRAVCHSVRGAGPEHSWAIAHSRESDEIRCRCATASLYFAAASLCFAAASQLALLNGNQEVAKLLLQHSMRGVQQLLE